MRLQARRGSSRAPSTAVPAMPPLQTFFPCCPVQRGGDRYPTWKIFECRSGRERGHLTRDARRQVPRRSLHCLFAASAVFELVLGLPSITACALKPGIFDVNTTNPQRCADDIDARTKRQEIEEVRRRPVRDGLLRHGRSINAAQSPLASSFRAIATAIRAQTWSVRQHRIVSGFKSQSQNPVVRCVVPAVTRSPRDDRGEIER